jgi:uncharacterized membrane protein YeaQ/YmgE (transglycosylase-associated protein family)
MRAGGAQDILGATSVRRWLTYPVQRFHLWLPSSYAFSVGAWSWNEMTILDLLVLLLIAGLCGALGQAITGYSRGGCLVSIALGFIGALLGMWVARQLGLPELFSIRIGTTNFPIIWSIIGSALFVAVIALISRRST